MKPSIEKLSTMFTRLNTTVPFSDVNYYANQIEIIFEVSEVEAYELAQQLKEKNMKRLQISGFKHITATGIARLYQELDSYGTIGMLYEITGDEAVNMLMNTRHYDSKTYIKEHYAIAEDTSDFDDIGVEIHDELVDAYTMVIWGYSHLLNRVEINGRTINNLSSAVDIRLDTWEHKPVTIEELDTYCANTIHIKPVHVRLFTYEEGHSCWRFEWTIGEAEEFHIFAAMYETIRGLYPKAVIQII